MGLIVPPQDSNNLARALISILDKPNGYNANIDEITNRYAPETIAMEYEGLFEQLIDERGDRT
jgi:hypothetical protein